MILEAIYFFGMIAAWITAENIPLCAFFLILSFTAGIICGAKAERQAGKIGNSKKEN